MPKAKPPASSLATPRTELLRVLQGWEPAAGADGFEGLVAQALATLTGYTFRLARSGSQFGRDAGTPNAPFAIAMEAKRYKASVPLQELAGKASLAAFALADRADLWILAATVEVSEPTARTLEELLEAGGVTLLTLDWTDAGLSPLAVLLAAERTDIVPWAKANSKLTPKDLTALQTGLDDIADDPAFGAKLAQLQTHLSSQLLGLDALRAKSTAWCEQHFASRRLAQRKFSQFLAPLEAGALTADRPAVLAAIDAAVAVARADAEGETLVTILGGEGSGKTWAIAQWWLAATPRPVLLLSVGSMSDDLSGNDEPIEMLARLAAHQDARRDQKTVDRWRRRLERWAEGEPARDRFIVMIDGLNETSGKAWATILRTLMPAVRDLGGVVVATSREVYWDREVAARLSYIVIEPVRIGDYDDGEFADILKKNDWLAENGVDRMPLPERLDKFMRNPRICALALTLLPQLSSIEDLSIDRLLLEYWRARVKERGDLVGHDDADFRKLLISHAKEYRERPGTDFDRDEWRTRSGAAKRHGGRALENDLNDIEEGRFFDSKSGGYCFRPEALHFALGLLISDELRAALQTNPEQTDETLAGIIDPIRGFDIVAEILTAAIAVASLDTGYPDRGIAALTSGWMSLQNLTDGAFDDLLPYVAARPHAFLDAWETRDLDRDDGRFLQLLLLAAKRDNVAAAMDARIARWLGSWTREANDWGNPEEQAERRKSRDERIADRLGTLTADERAYLDAHCPELPSPAGLSHAAALYLLKHPQAQFARGVVAFAFAYVLAGHPGAPYDHLAWAIRLNRVDHADLARAVQKEIEPFTTDKASELARKAAACALRLLGSLEAEAQADVLNPRPKRDTPRSSPPDPLDPETQAPAGIAAVAAQVTGVDPAAIWNHMSATGEDHDLERNQDLLLRFDFASLRTFLDRVAATAGARTDMPLRQLGWHLPWLTPILDENTIGSIRHRIGELVADPSLAPDGDAPFVIGMMVESVLPGLEAGEQLDLLQSLPSDAPFYFRYAMLAKPISGDEAAKRLGAVLGGDAGVVERTLLLLAAATTDISDNLRGHLIACLKGDDPEIVAAAAEFARTRSDAGLNEAILQLDVPADEDTSWRAAVTRGAISNAIANLGREDLVAKIPVEHLDWVAARMPAARDSLADTIDDIIDRFARPLEANEPSDAIVVLEMEDDDNLGRTNLVDRGEKHENPMEALNAELGDVTGARFARRRKLLSEQLDRFLTSLAIEGALMVAKRPYTVGLNELATADTDRYRGWLKTILAVTDHRALRQLQNIGFALAQNFADIESSLTAEVFAHLWHIEPHVTVVLGPAKHPIRHLALFTAPISESISALRGEAFENALDDTTIEQIVMAAEAAGASAWLDAFVDSRLVSATPGDQAMAITIASFRPKNAQSDTVLARDWGAGFLGGATEQGRARYRRAIDADHWFTQAIQANDPHERWRYLELGVAGADRRHLLAPLSRFDPDARRMGGDLPQRLKKAAEKVSNNGRKTFLGARRPNNLVSEVRS